MIKLFFWTYDKNVIEGTDRWHSNDQVKTNVNSEFQTTFKFVHYNGGEIVIPDDRLDKNGDNEAQVRVGASHDVYAKDKFDASVYDVDGVLNLQQVEGYAVKKISYAVESHLQVWHSWVFAINYSFWYDVQITNVEYVAI